MKLKIITLSVLSILASSSYANEVEEIQEQDVQDMSDPMAVYTQGGFGFTNKGINLKFGQAYDTGNDETIAMNVLEIKGIAGERLGWDGSSKRDDSIDTVRYRNFSLNTTNGLGKQIDLNYDVESDSMDASYSFMQALPKFGIIQLYPLAGVGVNVRNGDMISNDTSPIGYHMEDNSGYTIPGTYAVVGTYSKITITDKIWLNYNPMWLTTLSGSSVYKDHAFAGDSNMLLHEVSLSYQINPKMNARYFSNWNDYNDFENADHRIELNYQF